MFILYSIILSILIIIFIHIIYVYIKDIYTVPTVSLINTSHNLNKNESIYTNYKSSSIKNLDEYIKSNILNTTPELI